MLLTRARAVRRFSTGALGQPSHRTHPHIVPSAEHTVRGISKAEFKQRRETLASRFPNQTLVFVSAAERKSSHDTSVRFRQDSTFNYLFGFHEPEAIAVLKPNGDFFMFCRPSNPLREQWDGPRCGYHRAAESFGTRDAFDVESLHKDESILRNLISDGEKAVLVGKDVILRNHVDLDLVTMAEKALGDRLFAEDTTEVKEGEQRPTKSWRKVIEACDEMRLVKTTAELDCIREAGDLTARTAFTLSNDPNGVLKGARTESWLKAWIGFEFSREPENDGPFFDTIVANSDRACTLHYVACDQILNPDSLTLFDFGASLKNGYGADCSRTVHVHSKTSSTLPLAHEVVKAIVQDVQKQIILKARAGVSILELQQATTLAFAKHFQETLRLGRDLDQPGLFKMVRRYFPHGVSHFLGLDVHDTPTVKRDKPLPVNSVITIEPGLYFPPNDESIPAPLRGIGVRIEDSVVLKEDSCALLTRLRSEDNWDLPSRIKYVDELVQE